MYLASFIQESWQDWLAGWLTNQPTAWNRVLRERLTGFQPGKKTPALYGTRRFITAFTKARHQSLSWARSVQFMTPDPTSRRLIWILFVRGSSLMFPHKNSVCTCYVPHVSVFLTSSLECYLVTSAEQSSTDRMLLPDGTRYSYFISEFTWKMCLCFYQAVRRFLV